MKFLHRFSIRHPFLVVTLATLGTAAVAPGILELRLRTDGHALVPEQADAVRRDRAVRAEFGVRDPLVVLVRPRHPDGIFNPGTLHLVADLTAALARLPGLDTNQVRSIASERGDRFKPGTLQYRRLLDPVPESRAQIDELRGDLEAIRLFTGTYVSFDGGATAILVGTPPDADRTALASAVDEVIARTDTAGHRIDVIGAPVAEALLGSHILEDLGVPWQVLGRRPMRFAESAEAELGAMARLRLAIARRIGLLPLALLVMALVFLLSFRSLTAVLLPLGEAAAGLVFVFGLMGTNGVPVYLTMAVLPVILVSMGLADEIHVFSGYRQRRSRHPDEPVRDAVRASLDDLSLPVITTSITTAVGFLSFALSPLEPVRAFGIYTAIGVLFCMLWTLTVIPAFLVWLDPRGPRPRAASTNVLAAPSAGFWGALGRLLARWPIPAVGLAIVGLALCPLGIRRITVQDSWVSGFAPESPFRRATEYFNQHFYGTHRLLLALDAGRLDRSGKILARDLTFRELSLPDDPDLDPVFLVGCSLMVSRPPAPDSGTTGAPAAAPDGAFLPPDFYRPDSWGSFIETAVRRDGRIVVTAPITHGSPLALLVPAPSETLLYRIRSRRLAVPGVLRRIEELQRLAERQRRHAVGGTLGPADQIITAEFLTNYREPEWRRIPRDPERVQWLWRSIRVVHGSERLREMVDPELGRGLVTVFLKNANYVGTAQLMDSLRAFERARLLPEGIRLEFAGDVAVSQALIEAIVSSQVRSVLASLLGILVVTTVLFRSLRWGLVCTLPATLAVAAIFAVMGGTGMPLGVATSMFAGMVLGIGVDFAIHLVERFRLSMRRGAGREAAIVESLSATGPAIVINGLAVALGFGVLMLSRVPANARLGELTAVGLVACLLATLLVLPALLRLVGPRQNGRGGNLSVPASSPEAAASRRSE